jgi:hypothetical protein
VRSSFASPERCRRNIPKDTDHDPPVIAAIDVACGRRVFRRHVLPFDAATGRYPVPKALLEGHCPPAP